MFYFNTKKFDFWEIYDCIKRFYPIGIQKDETNMFRSYPGFKELDAIMVDNFHNDSNFKNRWQDFSDILEKSIQKPIIGTTYGQAPSFSSFVQLDKFSVENYTHTKELHFFVSLVGPFYTVIGQDLHTVQISDTYYIKPTHLIISPENEYADTFNLLCDEIEKQFTGFRFVPFEICKQTIEGLDVRYANENLNAIFNALFNDHIDLNMNTLGNEFYKYGSWIKKEIIL